MIDFLFMIYGLPYKGSKNGIVPFLIDAFPRKKNFYDLFAGGCAVTHGALLSGKFENFFINDISDYPEVFLKAINGGFKDEKRWISREDFFNLKDKEAYIRYCWSFGNKGFDYLYSKEIEPWKKALHYARIFNDFSLLEAFGIKTYKADRITVAKNADEWKKKYIEWYCKEVLHSSLDVLELRKNLEENIKRNSEKLKNYLIDGLQKARKRPSDVDRYLGTNGMAGHYFGKSQWEFPTREVYIKLQSFLVLPLEYEEIYGLQELLQRLQSLQSLESLQRLQRLESLERLQRLESLESLQSLESLESLQSFRGSYEKIKIRPDSVIYCDIPYRNKDEYYEGGFDYERFYDWCEKQTEPLYISEYWMPPERFECVASIEKSVTLCSGSGKKAVEKLFVPKVQIKKKIAEIKNVYVQQEFDFF